MRMFRLFVVVASFNLCACVAGDNEGGDQRIELDDVSATTEPTGLPDSDDLAADVPDELPALESERAPVDADIIGDRTARPATEPRSQPAAVDITRDRRAATEPGSVKRWQ